MYKISNNKMLVLAMFVVLGANEVQAYDAVKEKELAQQRFCGGLLGAAAGSVVGPSVRALVVGTPVRSAPIIDASVGAFVGHSAVKGWQSLHDKYAHLPSAQQGMVHEALDGAISASGFGVGGSALVGSFSGLMGCAAVGGSALALRMSFAKSAAEERANGSAYRVNELERRIAGLQADADKQIAGKKHRPRERREGEPQRVRHHAAARVEGEDEQPGALNSGRRNR